MPKRQHYERAFEDYLRARRIPYVSVDEARKALLPDAARLRLDRADRPAPTPPGTADTPAPAPDDASSLALKSFDFVVYGQGENLLLEVKGRRIPRRSPAREGRPEPRGRLETWVTLDDVEGLSRWERLFGEGFRAAFVFVYWCDEQPPDGLFQELFERNGRWYIVRAVELHAYEQNMRTRSAKWRTVHVPAPVFERISRPFCPAPADASPEPHALQHAPR